MVSTNVTEPVLFRKSFKSPSVQNFHSLNLNEGTNIDSIQSISQESPTLPVQNQAVVNHENIVPETEVSVETVHHEPVNPEPSPFQRDYLPSHQPLVALEKYRPRRSNIRRSSRMNAPMEQGDKVSRPHHVLSTVPSFIADEEGHSDQSNNIIDNRPDSSLSTNHSSQTGKSIVMRKLLSIY